MSGLTLATGLPAAGTGMWFLIILVSCSVNRPLANPVSDSIPEK